MDVYSKETFELIQSERDTARKRHILTQPFTNLGNIGHNKVDELNDTTDLTTKGARLDA